MQILFKFWSFFGESDEVVLGFHLMLIQFCLVTEDKCKDDILEYITTISSISFPVVY